MILNKPKIAAIIRELSQPLHTECLRDRTRAAGEGEADLARGFQLRLKAAIRRGLEATVDDFERFMRVAMIARTSRTGYPIELHLVPAGDGENEAFAADVGRERCRLSSGNIGGLRRGLFWLEEEMTIRRSPALPVGRVERCPAVRTLITRSPYAVNEYYTGLDELTCRGDDFHPDAYLSRLAHAGVNAVWVSGHFRSLIATRTIPEIGPRRTRLDRLAALVNKAGRHGVKVYFFCMEPRLIEDRAVFAKYPDIRGATYPLACSRGETQLCTSSPRVQEYLREALAELFGKAPGLAGVIDIFHGERGTNCWMTGPNLHDPKLGCLRCAARPVEEGLAELLKCFADGLRARDPRAELLAWDYIPDATKLKVVPLLRGCSNIAWLSCFEHGGQKMICGQRRLINEYSLSYVGPANIYRRIHRLASRSGVRLHAKLQMGNTYELSSVPHIPVPTSVYRKFRALQKLGCDGAMISWVIGGFPSIMLAAAGSAALAPLPREKDFLRRLAALEWGERHAPRVVRAWRHFFAAFNRYPMNNEVFYFGPVTRSPAYHLYLDRRGGLAKPYNFGLTTEGRRRQPYEDNLKRWLGTFTARELIGSFRTMAAEWDKGVTLLDREYRASLPLPPHERRRLRSQVAVARAAGLQFASAANVIEFYHRRDSLTRRSAAARQSALRRLRALALADIDLAKRMKAVLAEDPTIGFMSETHHFVFTPALLEAKIRQVRRMLNDPRMRVQPRARPSVP